MSRPASRSPSLRRCLPPCSLRHVLEFPVPKVTEEAATFGLAHNEDIRTTVAIVVSDGDACAHGADVKFMNSIRPHPGIGPTAVDATASAYLFSDTTPVSSGGNSVKSVFPRGPGCARNGSDEMDPAAPCRGTGCLCCGVLGARTQKHERPAENDDSSCGDDFDELFPVHVSLIGLPHLTLRRCR